MTTTMNREDPSHSVPPTAEDLAGWCQQYNDRIDRLTKRQVAILRAMLQGCTNRKIAGHLDVSMRTVEAERSELQRVMGVDNPMTLVYRMGVYEAMTTTGVQIQMADHS